MPVAAQFSVYINAQLGSAERLATAAINSAVICDKHADNPKRSEIPSRNFAAHKHAVEVINIDWLYQRFGHRTHAVLLPLNLGISYNFL